MGKKSRMKRERQAIPTAASNMLLVRSPKIDDFTAQELNVLMKDALQAADDEAREQRKIDHMNNLPMGHQDNAHKIAETFDPINTLLDQIVATGEVNVGHKNRPIMLDTKDNVWFPMVPSLISMCDTFTNLAKQYGWADQTSGMRRLAKKLDIDMPFFIEDIDAARVTITWMREQIHTITPHQFSAEAIEIQIRDELAAA